MGNNEQRLGHIIKSTRKERNLTREQLAEKLNISTRYLAYIEEGERAPSYQVLCSVVYVLSIPPNCIFYPEDVESNPSIDTLMVVLRKYDKKIIATFTKILLMAIEDISDNKKYTDD